jgi:hypothetical protein
MRTTEDVQKADASKVIAAPLSERTEGQRLRALGNLLLRRTRGLKGRRSQGSGKTFCREFLLKCCQIDQVNEDEMGGACGTCRGLEIGTTWKV